MDIQFRVSVLERRDGKTSGGDTFIVQYPFTARAVDVTELQVWCLGVANDMARLVNSTLAYADVRITTDPAVVREWGVMPEHKDCGECQRSLHVALEWMRSHPGKTLVVGQMHWAA